MNVLNKINTRKRFALIDDDLTYQSIMLKCAKELQMELEVYGSLLDLSNTGLLGRYDAVIVDYDLGALNGIEIVEYLSALFGDIPMLIVSSSQRDSHKEAWPPLIKGFINKSFGYKYVLEKAQQLTEKKRVLLFDDDQIYGKLFFHIGKKIDIDVIACSTLESFSLHALDGEFDSAIIDYNLGQFKGPQVARIIEKKPIYLISNNSKEETEPETWDSQILDYFPKAMPIIEILKNVTSTSAFKEQTA